VNRFVYNIDIEPWTAPSGKVYGIGATVTMHIDDWTINIEAIDDFHAADRDHEYDALPDPDDQSAAKRAIFLAARLRAENE